MKKKEAVQQFMIWEVLSRKIILIPFYTKGSKGQAKEKVGNRCKDFKGKFVYGWNPSNGV